MILCYCGCNKKFKRIKFLLQHLSNGCRNPKGEIDYKLVDIKSYQQSVSKIIKYGVDRVRRVIINDRDKKRHTGKFEPLSGLLK
jgi:hypothetical protein